MKRVLIISPHFPPINAADMHRVRQSLPYFRELGWEPVVIAVEESSVESYSTDPLLLHTIPADIEVHKVKAWNVKKTRKYGLGSLSMRAYTSVQKKGDELLRTRKFDLVYFSTTAFHVMALGPRWKRKFKVPYILDIQDPWRNDFYLDKPKNERPPKFWLAYNLDKFLEAKTVPAADGIISVSQQYCDTFLKRYPGMLTQQCRVIPFGASAYDFEIMKEFVTGVDSIKFDPALINMVYVGRGGHDMQKALEIIFQAFQKGLTMKKDIFSRARFWFIGTSYATAGHGKKTITPVAEQFGIGDYVTEIPDRMPYFETLYLLRHADMLVVPGSTDMGYTASKIYPYLLAGKPILAVFNKASSVITILDELGVEGTVAFENDVDPKEAIDKCFNILAKLLTQNTRQAVVDEHAFAPYLAKSRTRDQVDFFEEVLSVHERKIA